MNWEYFSVQPVLNFSGQKFKARKTYFKHESTCSFKFVLNIESYKRIKLQISPLCSKLKQLRLLIIHQFFYSVWSAKRAPSLKFKLCSQLWPPLNLQVNRCFHLPYTLHNDLQFASFFQELKCPLDEFEMIYFSTGVKGKSFPLCPYCYNNPPFREMKKGSGCNQCVHPTCTHSIFKNSLSECIQCEEGLLILDPPAAPKWKLVCNK